MRRLGLQLRVSLPAILAGFALSGAVAACSLSSAGLAGASADDGGATADATVDGAAADDGGTSIDDGSSDAVASDSASDDDGQPAEAACAPFDAGVNGAQPINAFVIRGNAVLNENNDGRITLTNSNAHEKGAAWYATPLPPLGGYELSFTFRVGPNDTAGDGIAFAMLDTMSTPGVGDEGDGVGLRNLANIDGGVLGGYALVIDMFKNPNDPTDLAITTLKVVAMPAFKVVANAAVSVALNDGETHTVDVKWRAPGTLRATLHAGDAGSFAVIGADPSLGFDGPGTFGFTAATGGQSDSHNEIGGLTFIGACK